MDIKYYSVEMSKRRVKVTLRQKALMYNKQGLVILQKSSQTRGDNTY